MSFTESENAFLLKQSHPAISDGQSALKVGICHSKLIFSVQLPGILDAIVVRS